RAWLVDRFEDRASVKPIFYLRDGLLIRPTSSLADLRRLDFERPFDAWNSLVGVPWRGRVLILDTLPIPDRKWECPPIASTIKKILRSQTALEQLPQFTNRQVQELCRVIEERAEDGDASARLTRVRSELGSLADQRELARGVVSELITVASVQREIQVAKDALLEEFKHSRQDLVSELERLRAQRDGLARDIDDKKEEIKRQSTELTKNVKKAFENARSAGTESLGQVALFQVLLGLVRKDAETQSG